MVKMATDTMATVQMTTSLLHTAMYRDSQALSPMEAEASAPPGDAVGAVLVELGAGVVEEAGVADLKLNVCE